MVRQVQPSHYEIWLADDRGTPLRNLRNFSKLEYFLVVDGIGHFQMSLPPIPMSLLRKNYQIQIWRLPRGGRAMVNEGVFLIQYWKRQAGHTGLVTYTIAGPHIKHLLTRRIVAFFAGEAESNKTNTPDVMMAEVVSENLIPDSDTARSWSQYLTVVTPPGLGTSLTMSFAWKEVYATLVKIQQAAKQNGTDLYFTIELDTIDTNTGYITFKFVVREGQLGRDLSVSSGIQSPVIFSYEFGNLVEGSLEVDYRLEKNYMYAGGQGEDDDREIVEIENEEGSMASVFGRAEGFKDARNEETTAGVTAAGRAAIEAATPQESFTGKITDSDTYPYGLSWRVGDRATASFLGEDINEMITTVHVSVANRKETVEGAMSGALIFDSRYRVQVARSLTGIREQLADLSSFQDTKFKGERSGSDFTTTQLVKKGQYGFRTDTTEMQVNVAGTIRKISYT